MSDNVFSEGMEAALHIPRQWRKWLILWTLFILVNVVWMSVLLLAQSIYLSR